MWYPVKSSLLAALLLALADAHAHVTKLSKCIHRCESFNACQESLESLSCEAACETMCNCKVRAHRMLNKPHHCSTSMLEAQTKRLSLLMGKAHPKKAQAQSDEFSSYVPLEDFWPHAQGQSEDKSTKPRMLNTRRSLSLLKKGAEPWSQAARHIHRRHHKKVAFAQKDTKPNSTQVAQKPRMNVSSHEKVATPEVVAPKVATGAKKQALVTPATPNLNMAHNTSKAPASIKAAPKSTDTKVVSKVAPKTAPVVTPTQKAAVPVKVAQAAPVAAMAQKAQVPAKAAPMKAAPVKAK